MGADVVVFLEVLHEVGGEFVEGSSGVCEICVAAVTGRGESVGS